jgi:hypothetical protein
MAYTVTLLSPAERTAIIKRAIDASSLPKEDFYDFRSTKIPLPVIRISSAVPIYRMENFRTFTDQKEYLNTADVENDFFLKGQENESVQQIQHEILDKLARKGKDKSITPVIDALRKEKQREPLLITANGIMVNGNRRLAAIRELSKDNTPETASFADVTLMVLPADATPEEIIDIEASLQGRPETKLDYDWIGDAQLVKAQVNIHRSNYNVSQRLNRSEKDIKNTLQALAEADLYLKEWIGSEGEYSRVKDDAEQFFKDLPKNLEGKSAQLENVSRVIAWSLFDNRFRLPTRIYDYNAAFGKLAEDVVERLAENLGISTEEANTEDAEDYFSIDIASEDSEATYDGVINALKDKSNEDAVTFLIEATLDAIETAKGQKSGDAALKAVSQANSKLVSVDLSKANASTYKTIKKQLDAIAGITARLSSSVSELIKNQSSSNINGK